MIRPDARDSYTPTPTERHASAMHSQIHNELFRSQPVGGRAQTARQESEAESVARQNQDRAQQYLQIEAATGELNRQNPCELRKSGGSYQLPSLHIIGENGDSLTGNPRSPSDSSKNPGTQPDAKQQELIKAAQNTLADANASSLTKLSTVQMLADKGIHSIQVPDKDGHLRNYTIEQEKMGDRSLVHLYGQDDHGHKQIVLRGVANQDGTFSQEQDRHGHKVGFEGTDWARHMEGKSAVGHTKDTGDSTSTNNGTPPHSGWHNHGNNGNNHSPHHGNQHGRHPRHNHESSPPPLGPGSELHQPERPAPSPPPTEGDKTVTGTYHARGTGYYPHNDAMEGGYKDMRGRPLHTLQDYLEGRSSYVSVAMDNHAGIKYGQEVRIPEMNAKYGRDIPFRVVDTGGAFSGRGHSRIDICVRTRQETNDSTINGPLTLEFVD